MMDKGVGKGNIRTRVSIKCLIDQTGGSGVMSPFCITALSCSVSLYRLERERETD